jgi:hypothetical protein
MRFWRILNVMNHPFEFILPLEQSISNLSFDLNKEAKLNDIFEYLPSSAYSISIVLLAA